MGGGAGERMMGSLAWGPPAPWAWAAGCSRSAPRRGAGKRGVASGDGRRWRSGWWCSWWAAHLLSG